MTTFLKEALERVSGVSPIVGATASPYTPNILVWGKDGKVFEVPTDKLSETEQEDFFALCDEETYSIKF